MLGQAFTYDRNSLSQRGWISARTASMIGSVICISMILLASPASSNATGCDRRIGRMPVVRKGPFCAIFRCRRACHG